MKKGERDHTKGKNQGLGRESSGENEKSKKIVFV